MYGLRYFPSSVSSRLIYKTIMGCWTSAISNDSINAHAQELRRTFVSPHRGFASPRKFRPHGISLLLDSTKMFPIIESDQVPCGFVEVDVKLDDNGEKFDTMMIAGIWAGEYLGLLERRRRSWVLRLDGSCLLRSRRRARRIKRRNT